MTRTQIQLPDDVYTRAKRVCEQREISMAELARRGIEYILSVYSEELAADAEWKLPAPRRLGWKGLTDAQIKEETQRPAAEVALCRPRRK